MKQIITNYTFDAGARTITFNDYTSINLERLTLITNLTDGVIIYQFNNAAKGGTVAGNVLTLAHDTTTMADTDDLQIFYEVDNLLSPAGAQVVGTAVDRFFDNFADYDTVNTWEEVQVGTGMTVSGPLGGAAAGSSPYLNISSGTTINQKTILLSRATFSSPVDLRYQITASQRIANNRLIIGFVQVDDSGAILTSTSITTAPDVLNARNAVVHQHDGTTATTAQLRVRAAGSALDTFANSFGSGFTTVATGTTPNFLSATTYGLTFERDKINSRAYGQNVLTNTGGQFGYDRVLPNPTAKYKLVIIVENQGTAPASSTDWRIHLVNVMDAVRLDVSPRMPGSSDGSKAFPVFQTNNPTSLATTMAANATTTPAKAQDSVAGATDTGIPPLLVRRDAPTVLTPVVGDYAFPQVSNLGAQYVAPVAHTAGGATPYKLVSAATTNATSVKASAGQVYSIVATNTNAAVRYLKLYNKASAPTVGTDTPVQVYALPAGGGVSIALPVGMIFTTGIAFALTTGAADSDTGAVALSEILVNLTYL